MNLHTPKFESALKRRIRDAVRRSPKLRRERRIARRQGRRLVLLRSSDALRVGLLVLLLFALRAQHASLSAQLAFLALWSLFCAFNRAHQLLVTFQTSPDLYALRGLPLPADTEFRWLWQRFARQSAWFLLDSLAGTLVISLDFADPTASCVALIASTLQWLACLALALVFATKTPPRWPGLAATVGCLAAGVFLIARDLLLPTLAVTLHQLAPWVNLLLPTAWPLSLFAYWTHGNPIALDLAALLPLAVLIGIAWRIRRRILSVYGASDLTAPVPQPDAANEDPSADAFPDDTFEPPAPGPTEIGDAVRSRAFLTPSRPTTGGWIERRFQNSLSSREQLLVEVLRDRDLTWTSALRAAAIQLAVSLLLGPLIVLAWPPYDAFLWLHYSVAATIGALLALPFTTGLGRGFTPHFMAGVNAPFYAGLPIGFLEISRVIFRAVTLRTLAATPLFVAYATAVAWLQGAPVLTGLAIGLKAVWAVWCVQPVFLTFRFSAGTNDSRRLSLAFLTLFTLGAVAGASLLILGFLMFLLDLPKALLCAALLPLPWRAFHFYYGRAHSRARFDLLASPQNQA